MVSDPRQGNEKITDQSSDLDIDEGLYRGVVALHASGRLHFEDIELDRALVLAIVDAVFPMSNHALVLERKKTHN